MKVIWQFEKKIGPLWKQSLSESPGISWMKRKVSFVQIRDCLGPVSMIRNIPLETFFYSPTIV